MSGNLFSILAPGFARDSAPCMYVEGTTLTYGEVSDGARRIAALLFARGIQPGDRVVIVAPKTPAYVMLYLAVLQVGAVFVPLNTAYTEHEIEYFIGNARPALVVSDAEDIAREAARLAPATSIVERSAHDPAAILYTSGTTGRSKGAVLSHGNLAANARALTDIWRFSRDDVLLHALPVFHVHGLFVALHCALLSGCSMAWLARFDEDAVIDALAGATVMMGVPTFYTRLLAHPRFTQDAVASVRLFISGSAPLLEATFAAFEERTGHRILERYGMSEAVIITSNPLDGERVAGSVGFALPGVEVRIAGHSPGAIQIRGPSVFAGYWEMPDRNAQEFIDGWFVTGDVGQLDGDGRLWISGRAKDVIISGGFNVYPKEVELVLDTVAGVVESAVIGVPHPDFGEAVVAVIEGTVEADKVTAAARRQLAGFKLPKRVFRIDQLPRNTMGKVQKNLLRDRYANTFSSGA